MAGFEFQELELKGACLISNFYAGDNRGGFTKSFEKDIYKNAGIEFQPNETFASRSMKNVIRGLHFQTHNPQAKLVSVAAGKVWDVIVDLRPDSPSYKRWISRELSAENHLSFYVPRGFAHGFVVLSDVAQFQYKVDNVYAPQAEASIRYDDPTIGVEWGLPKDEILTSPKDENGCEFKDADFFD
jgi:dTDP-4-dehydrorhamnose 3,5-epimerase